MNDIFLQEMANIDSQSFKDGLNVLTLKIDSLKNLNSSTNLDPEYSNKIKAKNLSETNGFKNKYINDIAKPEDNEHD